MASELPFDIYSKRGGNCDKLIEYVVLAEFDIDTGSTVRHQFPCEIPGYKADWFAEFMLPEGAHNRQLDYTYIFLNRNDPQIDEDIWIRPPSKIHNPLLDDISKEDAKHFLYGINLVKTRHDSSVRRGAIVKAMCVFSRYHYIESFKKPLDMALERYFNAPGVEVLRDLFESLNAVDLTSLERPNLMEQCLMRRGVHHVSHPTPLDAGTDHLPQSWYRALDFRLAGEAESVSLSIPLFQTPDEVGDISVTALVKTFGDSVMRIFHAILMRQRVLFVGYNHAASDVAQMVLSSVAMVAPPLTNLIKRTFPYANLSDLSFLEVKGYISGVTNPMFQQRDTWWDLLCVLDLPNGTGTITSAEERRNDDSSGKSSVNSPGGGSSHGNKGAAYSYEDTAHYALDNRFIQGVQSGIAAKLGEAWVRQQFCDYMTAIVNHTQDRSILSNGFKVDEKHRKFVDGNAARVAVLYSSPEFKMMPAHPWAWCLDCDLMSDHESLMLQDLAAAQAAPDSLSVTPVGTRSSSPMPSGLSTPKLRGEHDAPAHAASSGGSGNGGQGIAFGRDFASDVNAERLGDSPQPPPVPTAYRESPLPPMHSTPSSSNMDAIANTAAALFSAPRKVTDRHKDKGSLMKSHLRKMQYEIALSSIKEVQQFFQQMDKNLRTESSLRALLVLLPESTGGLTPIASGLFHINPVVRYCAAQLLTRLKEHKSTRSAVLSLNRMFLQAYERQLVKISSGALQKEIEEAAVEVSVDDMLSHNQTLDRNNMFANSPADTPQNTTAVYSTHNDLPPLASVVSTALDGLAMIGGSIAMIGNELAAASMDAVEDSSRKSGTIDELDLLP